MAAKINGKMSNDCHLKFWLMNKTNKAATPSEKKTKG